MNKLPHTHYEPLHVVQVFIPVTKRFDETEAREREQGFFKTRQRMFELGIYPGVAYRCSCVKVFKL